MLPNRTFKDAHKWSLVLAATFVVITLATTTWLYFLSEAMLFREGTQTFMLVLFFGLPLILISGCVTFWVTHSSRKEVIIYKKSENEEPSLNGHILTVSPNITPFVSEAIMEPLNGVERNGAGEMITIYAEDKSIRYISPQAESLLGYKQLEMIGESDLDRIHPDHRASFSHVFSRLRDHPGEKINIEYAYRKRDGQWIWLTSSAANRISDPAINGYLLRSQDVTKQKKIELEIHLKNKKITESIGYAKRIQGAILPNSRVINRALPDSFILYKPRDVVSGDFPWFAQVKNEIFMAAVDCTGHGVPGALLSLVGYFLLNDIVRSRKVTDPGKILDLLDEGVSTTLRPDEDAGSKDGMDISLCKINTDTRTVEYAGAHRPLYFLSGNDLREIKGNRFPIGGGIFKNQTNFSSNTISYTSGDCLFFCSDGFCDQFGGPRGRKFGTRQLRELIHKVYPLPMKDAAKVFEEEWESWKGGQKQTDDVLLIGIRLK